MGSVSYFVEDIAFKVPQKRKLSAWLKQVIADEGFYLTHINYIFTSDEYLLSVNKQYLDHDYYTDIITFDQSEAEGLLEGDIYISVDRVKENADALGVNFSQELRRVMVHGLLHLCGYDDQSDEGRHKMRAKEDFYLSL